MKQTKVLLAGIIIGLLFGLWFGVNLGKDKPLYSNPFAEKSIQQKIKKSGERILEKSGEALEKGGTAIEKGGKALKDKMKDKEMPQETDTPKETEPQAQ